MKFLPAFSLLLTLVYDATALPTQATSDSAQQRSQKIDIRGIVADSSTGERLPGVNVQLQGTRRGATTNSYGFYLIANVPLGNYDLVVSAVGYERRSIRVNVVGDKPISVDIRLVARIIQTGEVVSRGAAISTLQGQGASVHIVTPAELEAVPAIGQSDVLRSLQMLPGITSTSDVSAKFYVRGGAGDQNLILLDGMKIYNPFHAFGLFSVLDPDIVKSAQIYTGAFPAGRGDRLSSIVNVTTREGNLSGISGIANINFLSGKLQLDGPFSSENSWLINGRSSLFSNGLNRLIPNPSPTTFYDLFAKGTIGTQTGKIGIRGYFSGDDVKPVAADQPDHSWRNAAMSVVLSGLANDRTYFDASVSYSHSKIARYAKAASSVPPASSVLDEMALRVELTSYLGDGNSLFEGFELNFPSMNDSLYTYGVFPNQFVDSDIEWFAWIRYVWKWNHLGIDAGIHSDVLRLMDGGLLRQALQPRITLSYDLWGNWVASVAYGIFTQNLITISNEDDLTTLFDAWLLLPRDLGPEEAQHLVAGVEGTIIPSVALSLQAYTKNYSSLVLYNAAKIYPGDPDYLKGTGYAWGTEALARYASPLLDVYASYALSSVTVTANGLTYVPRYDRRHTVKAMATLHIVEGMDMSLRWEYGSGYPFTQSAGYYDRLLLSGIDSNRFPGGTAIPTLTLGSKNTARLPAYQRVDASLSYAASFGMFRTITGISIINLFGQKNILYYDRSTGKTEYMIPFFPTASLTVEF